MELYLKDRSTASPPAREAAARDERRHRMVRAMRERVHAAHARRHRFRNWRRFGLGALALGTAAAGVAVMTRPRASRPGPMLARTAAPSDLEVDVGVGVTRGILVLNPEGTNRRLAAGEDILVGTTDALETPERDSAQVRLSEVVRMTLSPGTRVAHIQAAAGQVERVTLAKGQAHVNVTKLTGGRHFHVITPDVDVQVHGTEFDVQLGSDPARTTCVRVQDGLVEVTAGARHIFLSAGRSWGCEPGQASAPPAQAPRPQPAARPTARETSDLRIQNALFQRALRDERGGRHAAASQTYQQLLQRFPRGPLSAQARANLAAMSSGW